MKVDQIRLNSLADHDFKDLVMRVNQAYASAGFNLSRALLPKQRVDDGLIEIRLLEDADLHHHF